MQEARILVVDDESGILEVLQDLLRCSGFSVELAKDAPSALKKIRSCAPDLILLDIQMPGASGWGVLRRIRKDLLWRHIPVLFLTSRVQTYDKVRGLKLGATDYITKPFESEELIARVRSALGRAQQELEANPLSHLPGNPSIEREIKRRIRSGSKFAVLYADLNYFKAFNDRYGFQRGDQVIQRAGEILLKAAHPSDFIGHIGGDDFLVITQPQLAEAFCIRVISEFSAIAPSFYDPPDRERGAIEVLNRQGNMERFPMAGFSIGIVTNETRPLSSVGQISKLAAEVKRYAKKGPPFYAFERRAMSPKQSPGS